MKQQLHGGNESQGAKVGAVLCSASFLEGGNWGYLPSTHNDYKTLLGLMEQEQKLIKLMKVSNGAVVLADEAYLNNAVAPLLNPNERELAAKNHKERKTLEKNHFLKFMEGVVQKTTKYGVACEGFKEYSVGIYSTNKANKIYLNGIEYPAFKMTLVEVLECLALTQKRCTPYVKVQNAEGKIEFKTLEAVKQTPHGLIDIARGLEISDTQTGVFITIRI